jgi:chromosome segregation protein
VTAETQSEEALVAALVERQTTETALRDARQHWERLRAEAAAAAQRSAAQESRRQALEQELVELERQSLALGERDADGNELGRREAQAAELRERQASLGASLQQLRERLVEAQAEHANALAEAQARSRAAQRSRQAFEARRGYAQGPRNALSSGIPGLHGSVADLLRVPDEYREAVGAALGRRLEYVVVDRADTGQKVLDHVRRSGGFVTVLPLDLIDPREPLLAERLRGEPAVVGLASELVEAEPRFVGVVNQLLGSTVIVRSMPEAVALARREKSRPRMVTLEGDIVESYGAMSGGRREGQAGVLGAAAELEEAEASAAEAAEQATAAEQALVRLQAQARELIDAEAAGRRELDEALLALAESRENEAGRRELAAELDRRRERALSELERMEAPPAPVEAELLEAAEGDVQELEARLEACRKGVEERQREAAESRQARLVAVERRQAFEAAEAQYRRDLERRESLAARAEALTVELERATEEQEGAARKLEEAERSLPADLQAKAQSHQEAVEALAEVETRLAQAGEAQSSRGEALERLNVTLARREAAWELASEELRSFPPGIQTVDGAERGLRARLAQASEELASLGAVNHRAAQELEQEQQRLDSLKQESATAQSAIEELAATLEQLDFETTTRLEAGVDALRDGFRRHVIELFGESAESDIEVERDEGRPVGIRIRLQPPGKQTRQLNLLSVGERTMGAMAFLFALMSGGGRQGLPIAILDEVDAPLDEANIRRYCEFLSRLSRRGTQFVLITHQKATFEVADVMWGVTTEQGVSRVFSIARSEAVALG